MPGKHPTVLAAHLRDDGVMDGCNQYRFRIPFEELRSNVEGGVFDWAPIGTIREWASSSATFKPQDYDMWVMPRHRPIPYEEGDMPVRVLDAAERHLGVELERKSYLLDLVRIMKGKVVLVLEYDDDYWTGSRDLGYEYPELLIQMMKEVDLITVSTQYLRDLVQKYAPGVPVRILPNCVAFREWQGWDRWAVWPEDHITIALTGSATHEHDWQVLEDVLPRVLQEHGNVTFVGAGFLPDYLHPLFDRFPDRCAYKDFLEYAAYPGLIRQADIILAPVVPEDPFNWAKSAIKAIEGMASGRPVSDGKMGGAVPITSDTYYYRRVTGGNKRGLTVEHAPEAWYEAIVALVQNKKLRERFSRLGWMWVHDNRSIERKWKLWWDAYAESYRRKRK